MTMKKTVLGNKERRSEERENTNEQVGKEDNKIKHNIHKMMTALYLLILTHRNRKTSFSNKHPVVLGKRGCGKELILRFFQINWTEIEVENAFRPVEKLVICCFYWY